MVSLPSILRRNINRKLVLFQVARTHWITARVIGEKKFLIEKFDSEISVLIMPTS